ncbi:MAG: PAS domain S-box protein [Hydrogenophaga sp.]|nr:PAS domain S-box protein [Hydrogenophaga sp.]
MPGNLQGHEQTGKARAIPPGDFVRQPTHPPGRRGVDSRSWPPFRATLERPAVTDNHTREPSPADRFQLLVEAVQDYGIFMLDPSGRVMSWNAGAERIKGYRADEVIGKHFSMFYPASERERQWPEHELKLATAVGKYEEEGWRVRKDGTPFWANVVITAMRDAQGTLTGFGKVTRDLTERRAHEQALRQSEERFRLLIEGVRDYAIYMLDPEGIIQSWNSGAEDIKGYTASEVIGKHYSMFFRQEDMLAGRPAQELQDALQHGRTEDEGWRVRKDGSTFWANIIVTPIHGADGALLGFAKVTRDMSERSKLRELEHSLKRMNEFLAMLAHELRNPLAPIRNAVSILQLEGSPSPTLRTSRDMIDRQLTHLTRLIDDLLDAGRLTSGKIRIRPERVSFNQVAARAIEAVRPSMDARGQAFDVDIPSARVWVNADEIRLAQVLQNLLGNASKFTPIGGTIKLSARVSGSRLRVEVADNGEGIPAASIQDIFALFSQGDGIAASRQSGLGIGLALARSIVEMHGGTISATSPGLGLGSVFHVELPGASMDEQAGQPETPWLLVVDDNRDAADSLADLLRMLGCRVRTAYDGESALEAARQDGPRMAFVDIGMPGKNGAQVLRELRALPGGDTLFAAAVTGYGAEDEKAGRADFDGFDARLQKPVGLSDLRDLLARAHVGGDRPPGPPSPLP